MKHIDLTIQDLESSAERFEAQAAEMRQAAKTLRDITFSRPPVRAQPAAQARPAATPLGQEVLGAASELGRTFRTDSLVKILGGRYTLQQVRDACTALVRTGALNKEDRGLFSLPSEIASSSTTAPAEAKATAVTRDLLSAAATLKQPFTALDLMEAGGCDSKVKANQWLVSSYARGWLERASRGFYSRTKLFPQPGASAGLPADSVPSAKELEYLKMRGEIKPVVTAEDIET